MTQLLTPLEQAHATLQGAESAAVAARKATHAKRAEYSALQRAGGATAELDHLNAEVSQLATAERFAEAALAEARELPGLAQRELNAAQNAVAGLRAAVARHEQARAEAQRQADSHTAQRDAAQAQLHTAEARLASLTPPAQPQEQPPEQPAVPAQPQQPVYPLPVRTIHSQPPRYLAADGSEVGRWGEPLEPSERRGPMPSR